MKSASRRKSDWRRRSIDEAAKPDISSARSTDPARIRRRGRPRLPEVEHDRRCGAWRIRFAAGAAVVPARRRLQARFATGRGAGAVRTGRCSACSMRKYAMLACNCSACAASSSDVADICSEALAFCCVTLSSCWIAVFTCSAPTSCSRQAALISATRSAVFRMSGTSRASISPADCAAFTVFVDTVPISAAAVWLRSASLRTSEATTAKPRPARRRAPPRSWRSAPAGWSAIAAQMGVTEKSTAVSGRPYVTERTAYYSERQNAGHARAVHRCPTMFQGNPRRYGEKCW